MGRTAEEQIGKEEFIRKSNKTIKTRLLRKEKKGRKTRQYSTCRKIADPRWWERRTSRKAKKYTCPEEGAEKREGEQGKMDCYWKKERS